MKVIYHPDYQKVYALDPAANAGRMEAILKELSGHYDFVEPEPASEDDLRRVHTQSHIDSIKSDPLLYHVACLSAGGALLAAKLAMEREPSFGLIRPPGHHASADHCWGFCFFNNVAVALTKLKEAKEISQAFILDFDLHFGDGTNNIFLGSQIVYLQPKARDRQGFLKEIEQRLEIETEYHILAVSAGFDRHEEDWGGMLKTDDYRTIGKLVKDASQNICQGRRFAVLEGGYNHQVLGKNVKAFLEGFE